MIKIMINSIVISLNVENVDEDENEVTEEEIRGEN